jgi:hypothetical protein
VEDFPIERARRSLPVPRLADGIDGPIDHGGVSAVGVRSEVARENDVHEAEERVSRRNGFCTEDIEPGGPQSA